MADPVRKRNSDIEPDIRPHFGVIQGGGESTPERADLNVVEDSTAKDLSSQERQFGVIQGGGESTPERADLTDASQNIDKAREREQNSNWNTQVQGQQKPQEKGARLRGMLSKKGPLGVIAAIILGGGGALGFFGFTLMPITIAEHFTNDTNDVNASSQRKQISLFGKKIGGRDFQKKLSICNAVVSIRCKMVASIKPDLAERYEKKGFTFHDKTEMNGRVGFSAIEFPDGTIAHDATEFATLMRNNSIAASAFNAVYSIKNSLFVVGGWFKNVLGDLNLTKGKKIEGETRKETDKSYEDSVKGEKGTVSTSAVADSADENATEEQKKQAQANTDAGNETSRQINDAISKGKKLKKLTIKADGPLGAAQLGCLTYNMAGFIATTAKIKKAAYFAGFAMIFLTLASSIKAGAATNAEVETAMNVLAPSKYPSQIEDPATGNMIANPNIGENALDAEAYKVVAYGDQINLTGIAMKFFIAGGFLGVLEKIVTWMNDHIGKQTIKTACRLANSTVATVISFLAAPILGGIALILTEVLPIEEWAAELVNLAIDAAAGIDPTTDLIGSDAGNALFVGTAVVMGATAMKFGMKPGPLSAIRKNMADNHQLLQQEIAMKTYEASKTPLDVTNRYSFLGSMAYQIAHFMPTFQQPVLASAGKLLSAVPGSFNMLTKNADAAYSMPVADYSEMRFSQCKDETYAALKDKFTPDMFCAVRYVPTDYKDPEVVLDYMEGRGEIDPVSGAPKPGTYYEKYTKYCVNRNDPWGSTSIAAEDMTDEPTWYTGEKCMDTTDENTMSSEFTGYKVVQSVIDREDSSESSQQVVSGDAKELARQVANNQDIVLGDKTKADLIKFADTGEAVSVCNAPFTIDSGMLGAMQTLSGKYKILVNNIGFSDDRDRDLCDDGQHPKGTAVDINGIEIKGGAKTSWGNISFTPQEIPTIASYANDWLAALAPARGGVGQKGCLNDRRVASGGFAVTPPPGAVNLNGNLLFPDDCNHLHIDARVR